MATCLEDIIECSICMTELDNPQILPCHHTFCKACVDQLIARNTRKCPICNAIFLVKDVKSDFNRVKFLELLRPKTVSRGKCEACQDNNISHVCENCEQGICSDCHIAHQRFKGTRNHDVVSLEAKWVQLKPVYDNYLENLHEMINELDAKHLEHEDFKQGVNEIENSALVESQRFRTLYIQRINEKFDKIDASIRAYGNSNREKWLDIRQKLQAKRALLVSQCEKLRSDIESKDLTLITSKADNFISDTKESKLEFQIPPALPKIEIKGVVDLNIDEAVVVQFTDVHSRANEQQLTLSEVNISTNASGASGNAGNIAWQDLSDCFCINVIGGTAVRNLSGLCKNHTLILQQGFDCGTHIFKISATMSRGNTASIGAVSNDVNTDFNEQLKWTKPFQYRYEKKRGRQCYTLCVYMILSLDGTRHIKYKRDDWFKFTAFIGKLPPGPLYPMVQISKGVQIVKIEYVHDSNEIKKL